MRFALVNKEGRSRLFYAGRRHGTVRKCAALTSESVCWFTHEHIAQETCDKMLSESGEVWAVHKI